jgi:uncharacterized repeat protein (TIGR03806 family)
MKHAVLAAGLIGGAGLLAGCGSSEPATASVTDAGPTVRICPGPDAQKQALIAFFDAHEGDVIEFCEGQFNFTSGLVMMGKKGITIRGAGMNKTYLRFANSTDQDGFNLNRMTGITVEDLTIYDAPGNGLRIFRSDYVVVRRVKVGWSVSDPPGRGNPYGNYEAPTAEPANEGSSAINKTPPDSWSANGAYAFYPVICHHVLIEDSISVGSSDAGVYVGQSSDILVRRTEAYHNVAGFEFENTYRAEFVDNIAHDNTGGFLVFDLPGRVQYGEKNLVHHNISYNNNLANFAPRGAIVGYVPAGVGVLVLASDQLELYENEIYENNTVGLTIVNYGLVDQKLSQRRYDFFPEGMHIYGNTFRDNGGAPQVLDPERAPCTGPGGLPGPGDDPACASGNPGLIVGIIQAKNNGHSAQIVWDGGVDAPGYPDRPEGSGEDYCESIPVDRDGVPLTQANPGETPDERYEARADERGRPNLYQFDPEPACPYKAWKFNEDGSLKRPANGLCIEGNTFVKSPTRPDMQPVDDYVNVHFSTAQPTDPENQQPADHTLPSDCPVVATPLLPQFVPTLGSYVPDPAADPRPSQAERDQVCNATQAGQVNLAAVLRFNCPRLDQYGLFEDPLDPTRNPTAPGLPFDLNTALFSDYALKYRFLFLPAGTGGAPEKATYMDHERCDTINVYDCYTATLGYPVGAVFAKTFAFRDGAAENVVETRLLIKRVNSDGLPYWVGFAYEWTGTGAARQALLKLEGSEHAVSWDYDDPDPAAQDASGARPHYTGSTERYAVPNAGACLLCHGGDDREAGAAPIGPKVRNLNRDYDYGGTVVNQIQRMVDLALLDIPDGVTIEEPMSRWNVPLTGHPTDAAADKHVRARDWLEVNCLHCHNPAGAAQNSGLRLDAFTEPIDVGHGICKPPIAAGAAADFGTYDIEPANAARSILYGRVVSTEPGIKMPPLARSVNQGESAAPLADWIDNVVSAYDHPDDDFCESTAPGAPAPAATVPVFLAPVPPTPAQTAPWG